MPTLSGFADEISKDLKEQLAGLQACGLKYFDLRSVWGTNVMDLADPQTRDIKKMIGDAGIKIAAIASPIGKSTIDKPAQFELDRVKKAADLAEFLNCNFIRVFSFYPPEGKNIADYRTEVIARMRGWIDLLEKEKRPVVLTSENESDIYGDIPERNVDLMEQLFGPKMVQCYDPANFVYLGVGDVYNTCWLPLKKYTKFFHLKDCKPGKVLVPCGQGDGQVEQTLSDACKGGFDGFMTLEPHLAHGGQYAGFSGPDLFKKAVDAVREICDRQKITLK
ncbi:MAG: TIM barrel protein [Phycisphaerae bacterium]